MTETTPGFFAGLWRRFAPRPEPWPSAGPEEMAAAIPIYRAHLKRGVLAARRMPEPSDPAASRWGGPLLAKAGAAPPCCRVRGVPLEPLLQIRFDGELQRPPVLQDAALLTLWFDPDAGKASYGPENGSGFLIETFPSLDGLAPLPPQGPGFFPAQSLSWSPSVETPPSWDDLEPHLPPAVRDGPLEDCEEWLDDGHERRIFDAASEGRPVLLGGWPQWIQSSNWPEGSEFAFQISWTKEGRFQIGDTGSCYFFRRGDAWLMTWDSY